jgi:hypothetical protein
MGQAIKGLPATKRTPPTVRNAAGMCALLFNGVSMEPPAAPHLTSPGGTALDRTLWDFAVCQCAPNPAPQRRHI